ILESLYFSDKEITELGKRIKSDVAILEARRIKEIEEDQRQQKKIREELSYLRTNKLTLLRTGTYSPEDFIGEEIALNEKMDHLSRKIQASDVSMHEVMKD